MTSFVIIKICKNKYTTAIKIKLFKKNCSGSIFIIGSLIGSKTQLSFSLKNIWWKTMNAFSKFKDTKKMISENNTSEIIETQKPILLLNTLTRNLFFTIQLETANERQIIVVTINIDQ